jgi:hypothetical protein
VLCAWIELFYLSPPIIEDRLYLDKSTHDRTLKDHGSACRDRLNSDYTGPVASRPSLVVTLRAAHVTEQKNQNPLYR